MASIFTFLHKVGFHIDATKSDKPAHVGKILKDLLDLCKMAREPTYLVHGFTWMELWTGSDALLRPRKVYRIVLISFSATKLCVELGSRGSFKIVQLRSIIWKPFKGMLEDTFIWKDQDRKQIEWDYPSELDPRHKLELLRATYQ